MVSLNATASLGSDDFRVRAAHALQHFDTFADSPSGTAARPRASTHGGEGSAALAPEEARPSPVRVVVRFRPPVLAEELEAFPAYIVDAFGGTVHSADSQSMQLFQFDRVFGEDATQEDVYDDIGHPIVEDVLQGYHGTILAYGQTGGGKTHCMFGPYGQGVLPDIKGVMQGVVPRAVRQMFDRRAQEPGIQLTVECSFLEVYCEQLRDLLGPKTQQNLQVKEMPKRGFYVDGLTLRSAASADEVIQLLRQGLRLRAAANSTLNQHSSRSHAIFTLSVQSSAQEGRCLAKRKLTLVDLAGSEKVSKSGSTGEMLEEAKKINSSLSALGNVIDALADRRPHVPYRDSRLTRILEDSLGGNCRTALLIACSPSVTHASETLSSLRFAARTKKVCNVARVNLVPSMAMADQALLQRIAQLQSDLAVAHRDLQRRFTGPGLESLQAQAQLGGQGNPLSPSSPRQLQADLAIAHRDLQRRFTVPGLESAQTQAQLGGQGNPLSPSLPRSPSKSQRNLLHALDDAVSQEEGARNSMGTNLSRASMAPPLVKSASARPASFVPSTPAATKGASREDSIGYGSSVNVSPAKPADCGYGDLRRAEAVSALAADRRRMLGSSQSTDCSAESSSASAVGVSCTALAATPLSSWRDLAEDDLDGRHFNWLVQSAPLADHAAWLKQRAMRRNPSSQLSAPTAASSSTDEGHNDTPELLWKLQLERHRSTALSIELERRTQESKDLQRQLEVTQSTPWLPAAPQITAFGGPLPGPLGPLLGVGSLATTVRTRSASPVHVHTSISTPRIVGRTVATVTGRPLSAERTRVSAYSPRIRAFRSGDVRNFRGALSTPRPVAVTAVKAPEAPSDVRNFRSGSFSPPEAFGVELQRPPRTASLS